MWFQERMEFTIHLADLAVLKCRSRLRGYYPGVLFNFFILGQRRTTEIL